MEICGHIHTPAALHPGKDGKIPWYPLNNLRNIWHRMWTPLLHIQIGPGSNLPARRPATLTKEYMVLSSSSLKFQNTILN
jgi:hypothetical protein